MTIRKALKKDSQQAAVLIYDAIHDIGEALTGETDPDKILQQLAAFFQSEGNRLSFENSYVKVEDGEVVGIIILYHGKDAEKLEEPIIAHLQSKFGDEGVDTDKEADLEDFYIDTLSVSPEHGGRGIGTALIECALLEAKERGYPTVSLNVEEENTGAMRLYSRLGFRVRKTIMINGKNYHYLVRGI
ncbi:GNAT family N-acetyltransferase [Falsibacillus pallidus]|uniref:Acetyltransferase (GNAT) family protein n=1 Tax=Falsibacillus pallidus TaxID=493781 RepID=A0A370G5M6_9BACI|nr:GNAT family N-acetyltransferase [Falsibacillus pallidus]RDI39117.1 acetyltransferase (GNAT) family protein [Falsibacillus pallidus]